ncbi:MAG: hypothetical protein HY060_01855 [Proteobacteria bacterium]|nr:hypothetical protein [Pseudomonadota bacterium]
MLASAVPLIAFTVARRYVDYDEAVASTGQRTLALARSMALVVEKELEARITALQVLAASSVLEAGNLATFRARVETTIAPMFQESNLVVLREDCRPARRCRCAPTWRPTDRCSRPAHPWSPTCTRARSGRARWSRSTCRSSDRTARSPSLCR